MIEDARQWVVHGYRGRHYPEHLTFCRGYISARSCTGCVMSWFLRIVLSLEEVAVMEVSWCTVRSGEWIKQS